METAYESALREARSELAAAKAQRETLDLRIERLEAFIIHAAALASPRTAPLFESVSVPVPTPIAGGGVSDGPLWKVLIAALNGKKGRFTVPEAVAALDRIGRKINSKNRGTIVRNAIKDKPSLFGRYSEGQYFVRGYEVPPHSESSEEEGNLEQVAVH
jgi:hypothetical protein